MSVKTTLSIAALLLAFAGSAFAGPAINLSSPQWLGSLKLSSADMKNIRKAVVKALDAPIDAEQQCGEARGDCVVRAAREWRVGKETYREVVIAIHTIGHTSHAIGQKGGKWPDIKIK